MTCFHPIKVWQNTKADLYTPPEQYYKDKKVKFRYENNKYRREIEIPCGHCLGCRLDHANMWATRITVESKQWKNNCFVTLTYNNPHLPFSKHGLTTLVKKDFQDFMKRLRYYEKGIETWTNPITEKEEQPIRYFMCGEYGRKGERAKIGGNPHYHMAIFNWQPKDLKKYKQNEHGDWSYTSETLQKIWGKGFVVIEELNYNSACYIARYVQKKAGLEPEKREYTGNFIEVEKIDERNGEIFIHNKREIKKKEHLQEPEFIEMSRGVGIGRTYWEENKEKIKRNKGIFIKIKDKIKLKPLPRYYKKLWEKENYQEYYRYKFELENNMIIKKAEIISQVNMPDGTSKEIKYEFYLSQTEKILKEKTKPLKRNNFI